MPLTPVLSNRALCLAKIESTYNVDALPSPITDAFLVSAADVKINPNVLKREFYKPSLSPLGIAIGRKLASVTFTHEVKGSGVAGLAPKLGLLMRGCGMAQTLIAATAAAEIQNPIAASTNTGPAVTWTKTTPGTQAWGRYKVKVALGGASAAAKVIVFGNVPDVPATTILPADDFSATVMGPGALTTVAVNLTNPLVPTYSIGTPQIGDIVVISVGGLRYKYTIATAIPATEATSIAALLVDPNTRFTAAPTTNVVTVTITGGVTVVTTISTAINLGSSGAAVNMTWTGNLVLGDSWNIDLLQPGYHYTPVSTAFSSLTIYVYYDGTLDRKSVV